MHLLTVIFNFVCFVIAGSIPKLSDVTSNTLDLGLAAIIESPILHHDDVFSHAIRIIHDYEHAPSCHRVATKALLDSCQSLVSSDRSANQALDLVKSAFAARLAVCELHGAGASVPTDCMPLMPRHTADKNLLCRTTGLHCDDPEGSEAYFKPSTQQENNACLRALESKPQWWTSYSNARQNAILMCHAAREQVERDQLLDTYRAMTDNTQGLSAALAQSVSESTAHLAQQKAFAETVKEFQAQLIQDLELERRGARSIITNLMDEVQAEWHNVFEKIFGGANMMETKVEHLNQDLDRAHEETKHVRHNLQELARNMATREEELAHKQRTQWETTQALSTDVEDSLTRNKVTVEHMAVAMLEFRADMNAIYELMLAMHNYQTTLTSTTTDLTLAFADVHNQISSLKSGMHELATTQNETMNGFHAQLEGAQAMAAAFSDSLSNISTGGIASVLDHFWLLMQGLAIVALVIFVDWLAGKIAARIVAATSLIMAAVNVLQLGAFLSTMQDWGIFLVSATSLILLIFLVCAWVPKKKHTVVSTFDGNIIDLEEKVPDMHDHLFDTHYATHMTYPPRHTT